MTESTAPERTAMKTCDPVDPGGCALCGDEALPARVIEVRSALGVATVAMLATGIAASAAASTLDVALDLVDGVGVGDVVLVHQGFVISRMDVR